MVNGSNMHSFLRWPGGKRWLARYIAPIVRNLDVKTYFEPFLGSGALFFEVAPHQAVLSDLNGDLITCFKSVKDDALRLELGLKKLPCVKSAYIKVRDAKPRSELNKAVRFLYLNRTCYGGIYRVNKSGMFNVPFGGRDTSILTNGTLLRCASSALKTARLECADFETVLNEAKAGDFVYCDPIYTSPVTTKNFTRYGWGGGGWRDQERLLDAALRARSRGVLLIVSNHAVADVMKLYNGIPHVRYHRHSSLAQSNASVREVLFVFSRVKNTATQLTEAFKNTLPTTVSNSAR